MQIVLGGKMRSGKDTLADYAAGKYEFTKFAFGDELKRYYHELFGLTEGKPREAYQWFGQTMRQHKPTIWVDKCFEHIEQERMKFATALGYDGLKIMITDMRQPNEWERCFIEGYTFIKVECNDRLRLKRIMEKNDKFNPKDLEHETEKHIDTFEYDYVISNDGSLSDLYKQFDSIMSKLNE